MPCGETDRECLHEHVARGLRNAVAGPLKPSDRPGDFPDSIRADCPSHADTKRTLTVSLGADLRFVWCCHRDPACSSAAIYEAMTGPRKISAGCLPLTSKKRKPAGRKPPTDAEIVRELRRLLAKPEVNGPSFRFRAAMLLLDLDAKATAKALGIPERTARRLLCP